MATSPLPLSVFGHCWGQPILDVFHRAPTFGNRFGRIDRSVGRSPCARRSDRPNERRIGFGVVGPMRARGKEGDSLGHTSPEVSHPYVTIQTQQRWTSAKAI